jgi:POTRA domain, FtsQ-type
MRRRRAEVERASGWRRIRIAGSIVGVAAVLAGLFGVAHTRLIGARHVRVVGAHVGSVADVLRAAGIDVGEPMFDIEPGRAVGRLLQLPWVASATVTRVWPATVRVTVSRRHAVAQIPTGSSLSGPVVEVDITGRLIARSATARKGLPLLLGVGTPGAVGQWLPHSIGAGWPLDSGEARPGPVPTALAQADTSVGGALAFTAGVEAARAGRGLGATGATVSLIEVAADGTISAELTPGPVTVTLGSPTALPAKVTALVSMMRSQTFGAGSLLDLQVPDRPTLTGTAVPSAP